MPTKITEAIVYANLMEEATRAFINNKSKYADHQILSVWMHFKDVCTPYYAKIKEILLDTGKALAVPEKELSAAPEGTYPGENFGLFYDPTQAMPKFVVLMVNPETVAEFEKDAADLLGTTVDQLPKD